MKRIISIILAVVIIAGFFGYLGLDYGKQTGYEQGYLEAESTYEPELEKLTKQYEALVLKDTASNPEFYYGEAYIISQDEMPDGTINVCWCVNYSETQCFITYEPDYLDEEYPYLLTMYSNGTKDTLDDEVVVIWQAIR